MAERFVFFPWMIILIGAIVLLVAPLAKSIGAAAAVYGIYLTFFKPYHDSQKSSGLPPAEAGSDAAGHDPTDE